MSQHFHFVAIFSEPKGKVLENFTSMYAIRDVKPGNFSIDVGFNEEYGVTVFGELGRKTGKTKLELYNLGSTDWIGASVNSRALMTFCRKFRPEVAYIFYAGAIVSPKFIIFTKRDGVLFDIGKVKLLEHNEENAKIVKNYYGKKVDTLEEWEKLADSKPLMPIKKLV